MSPAHQNPPPVPPQGLPGLSEEQTTQKQEPELRQWAHAGGDPTGGDVPVTEERAILQRRIAARRGRQWDGAAGAGERLAARCAVLGLSS
jgi:hypothetical protein